MRLGNQRFIFFFVLKARSSREVPCFFAFPTEVLPPPEDVKPEETEAQFKAKMKLSNEIGKAILTEQTVTEEVNTGFTASEAGKSSVDDFFANMMGDAPACSDCGHITVRNGACYKCTNCGASMGCS